MADTCALGNYEVFLEKQGRSLSPGLAQLTRIAYSRVLDAPSDASVSFATTGTDCCGQLQAVDHWNTDLIVASGSQVVWRGPVKDVIYRHGSVDVIASDVLEWMQVRIVPEDLTYTDEDMSDIFIGVWNSAVDSVDSPTHSIVRFPSGVTQSRTIEASALRTAWNIASEMLETGLDVTTFGSQIVVGIPTFDPITMTDADVQGDIEVVKDGDAFANRVIANASADITASYPALRQGSNGYPLVETTISDSQLPDAQSAENAAKSRYDFSAMGVRRVRANGGLVLLPSAKLNHKTVIAGQPITFTSTQTCYQATETLRLGRLDVLVEANTEIATIDLQPYGSVAGLGSI